MDVFDEIVSLTLSYSDGLVRHIPDVSAFLVVRRIPMRHPFNNSRPVSVYITPTPTEECKQYLDIRLNRHLLHPINPGEITYGS